MISFADGKLTYLGIVTIALGSIIIIGSVVGMILCYMYKQKYRATGLTTDPYFNNLGYIDGDEKKKIPITTENNTHDLKEKEALQNV